MDKPITALYVGTICRGSGIAMQKAITGYKYRYKARLQATDTITGMNTDRNNIHYCIVPKLWLDFHFGTHVFASVIVSV